MSKSEHYILYFCSQEAFTNQTSKVRRGLTGDVSKMIGEVCNGELNIQKMSLLKRLEVKESMLYIDGIISHIRFLV